jgi:hypothetical protein
MFLQLLTLLTVIFVLVPDLRLLICHDHSTLQTLSELRDYQGHLDIFLFRCLRVFQHKIVKAQMLEVCPLGVAD